MKRLSQSDLARMAGVSRQAVSLWLRGTEGKGANDPVEVRSSHLVALARAAGVSVDDLVDDLPLLGDPETRADVETEMLWDRLYPGLIAFAAALAGREPAAVARLVQVRGMYGAAAVLGESIWNGFDGYKRFLPPVRRRECQRLWDLRQSPPRN
ncbi:MAG: helix-turn-helix transcriptional regulator [Planctomycetes bacterium]|nr:helix-turn-helix transcriptional regulator [Planctomycetota bacterium]